MPVRRIVLSVALVGLGVAAAAPMPIVSAAACTITGTPGHVNSMAVAVGHFLER